jgi:hypothetical protein
VGLWVEIAASSLILRLEGQRKQVLVTCGLVSSGTRVKFPYGLVSGRDWRF